MSQEAAGHGEGDNSSSSSSSSSSGGVAEGTMEAADEGRYAEDIPASEIEESLHQAEVSSFPIIGRFLFTDLIWCSRRSSVFLELPWMLK
jgi:hypothetical protein